MWWLGRERRSFGLKDGGELGRKEASVLSTEAKGDQGAGVGDYGVAHLRVQLAKARRASSSLPAD